MSSNTTIEKNVSNVKSYKQILKTVTECKYQGVVLSDDLPYTKDVQRAKVNFFKQFYLLYNKFYCMNQNALIYLLRLPDMSFKELKHGS